MANPLYNRNLRQFKSREESEFRFAESMTTPLKRALQIDEADIVVGIPFYNETDSIAHVIKTAQKGLKKHYPAHKSVIVTAGSPTGADALRVINRIRKDSEIERIAFLLDDKMLRGKGWGVRAIAEVANVLAADVLLLDADLKTQRHNRKVKGLSEDWIYLLLDPIVKRKYDIAVSKFLRSPLDAPVSTFVAYPILTAIYNHPIRYCVGAQFGVSHRLIRSYLKNIDRIWIDENIGYGIDISLARKAITSNAKICEVILGTKIHRPSAAKRELVLHHVLSALFAGVCNESDWWKNEAAGLKAPFVQSLARFGNVSYDHWEKVEIETTTSIIKYKEGFNKFHQLYNGIFPDDIYRQLEEMTTGSDTDFHFPPRLWVQIIYQMLLAYSYGNKFTKRDIIESFIPLFNGFLASYNFQTGELESSLSTLSEEQQMHILVLESEHKIEMLAEEFLRQKPDFIESWEHAADALKPPVPQITYREFIPGVPLVVPTELTSVDGKLVRANDIYNQIFTKQKEAFDQFIYDRLNVHREASSLEISLAIKDFMKSIEDEILPNIDLSTIEGIRQMVEPIFRYVPQRDGFSLTSAMAARFLAHYPPLNLITKFGCDTLDELLGKHDPLDILALTNWSEERDYMHHLWHIIAQDLRSEHFTLQPIKPLIVNHDDFPSLLEMKDSSAVDKLTSRVIVSNLHKGIGGEFPKLRYLATISKNIVEAESFSQLWERFAMSRKDFGRKVIDSLRNHWGREPLSAHNLFEDKHQRILADRMRTIVDMVAREDNTDDVTRIRRYKLLKELVECYNLALILPDGEFVTCSAWSWASYSFKGGKKSPPPLSAHVERDWASREFLVNYFTAIGGTEDEVDDKIFELIEQGREWENLAPILLGTEKGAETVIQPARLIQSPEQPQAGELIRFKGNPILEPIKEHKWESKYVLNAGSIRLNANAYIAYRAFGEDKVSRIGLAVSDDGFTIRERLDKPIFEPINKSEKMGCEDPRLTLIDDRVYMAYTAYDGQIAQIALASIKTSDFTSFRWNGWQRHGLVFPNFDDKDAAMFPEKFNDKYAMLHRVDPHMWITFSSHLRCPWPRREHKILAGTTTGLMWDGRKIGAGAQPIKTKYGWLLITHGVDYAHVYRLGVMLLDLDDPARLVYRSPNYILQPGLEWEIGISDQSWVPNVVFTCGALPRQQENGSGLEAEDELMVYYGASDTVIGLATAKVGDLIPAELRNGK